MYLSDTFCQRTFKQHLCHVCVFKTKTKALHHVDGCLAQNRMWVGEYYLPVFISKIILRLQTTYFRWTETLKQFHVNCKCTEIGMFHLCP